MQTNGNAQAAVERGPFSYKVSRKSVKSSEGGEVEYTEVALAGKLEFLTGFEQEKNFADILEIESGGRLVINLRDISFINSLGLNFLLNEFEKCHQKGIKLYMAAAAPYVMKVFTITRLDGVFKLINESADCANEK